MLWIVDIRRETIGFEQHSLRHVRLPAVHQATEDPEAEAEAPQISSDGETVRTRANNRNIKHDWFESSLSRFDSLT